MTAFSITRTAQINAPVETIHALIANFAEWQKWSPWEGLDPNLQRTFTGPASGVGAHYAWSGNKKAGQGTMEITADTGTQVDIALSFEKPWKAQNKVVIALKPVGDSVEASWTMSGENKGFAALFSKRFNMDAMLGKDFEKGLAQLKAAAES